MSNSQDAVLHERWRDSATARLLLALPQGVVLVAFLLLLVVAPLPLGANRDWAWAPMAVAVGVIAVACMLTTLNSDGWRVAVDERVPLLALLVCFALMTAVALAQMTTLSASAGAAPYYAKAADILGRAHTAVATLAVDASRNGLLKCVACGLIFLVSRTLLNDTRRARLLLVAFGLSGVLVTGYSIFLATSTNFCFVGSFLKKQTEFEQHDRCLMSGTFVSPNNFGCFCGMALVAMIALMFVERRRRRPDFDDEEGRGAGARFLAWITGTRLMLLALAFLFLGCLMISGSRAGFAATIAGVMALLFLMMRERLKTRRQLGRAFLIGIAVAALVGLVAGGSMVRKISYFQRADSADRLIIWDAAVDAIAGSPWWGWGLGSFADIYAVYQPKQIIQPNDKAHSTPLETVVELGIPGAVPAWLVVLIPWALCLRGAWRRRRHRYLPAAAFAISTIAIVHSIVDFSLQIPAIAFVVAAFLGMGWAQAFSRTAPPPWAFTSESE